MQTNRILLKNGSLIDGTGKEIERNVSVGILNSRIESIYHENMDYTVNGYDRVVELDGLTILPGFINSHVHSGFKYIKDEPCNDFQEEFLRTCLIEGITTIRDEGMFTEDTIENVVSKKDYLAKTKSFPRIITTGKFFSAPSGYGGVQPIHISSVEEVKRKVNEVLDKGIDMIKTVLEDGMDPSSFGLPKLSDELLKAICDQAHKRGAKVSAHVTQAHNLKRLVDAGIDDAGHMVYDDLSDELIDQMIKKDIFVVPTLSVLKMFQDKYGVPLLKKGMKNVFRFVQAGGKIGLGNDFIEEELPWYRLGMPKIELQLLKEAGLTNMQIIISATKHAAEICSISHEVGTVERGKIADLLITHGNPLEDLESIYNIKMVIKEGDIVVEN